MILLQGERIGCEQCIRGHRAADCHHLDKPLVTVKGRGKPNDKYKSIRLKVVGKPIVQYVSEEEIDTKNGRTREGITKPCYHLDPRTPCCFFVANIKNGFSFIGPLEVKDNYFTAFKVNINETQNINLVHPTLEDFKQCEVVENATQPRKEEPAIPIQTFHIDDVIEVNPKTEPQTPEYSYISNESEEMFSNPTFQPQAPAHNIYATPKESNSTSKFNLQIDTTVEAAECGCCGMIVCPSHLLAITEGKYDPNKLHISTTEFYKLPSYEDALNYYEIINYGKSITKLKEDYPSPNSIQNDKNSSSIELPKLIQPKENFSNIDEVLTSHTNDLDFIGIFEHHTFNNSGIFH